MNLLKSRRGGAVSSSGGAGGTSGGGNAETPLSAPWRHMGGEHSAFKAFPQAGAEQENGTPRRYASSETSEEINVTTDDEDSSPAPPELSKLTQADVRASIESWREMAALSALRGDPTVFSTPPTLRDPSFPPASAQPLPLPLTKHDRL